MPDWKEEIINRLADLKLEPTREAEIAEELAQHLEDRYTELLASGASEEKALAVALVELNESELLTRELRRVEQQVAPEPLVLGANRRTKMIADLWQDLRYGIRLLLKKPGFTLLTVLTLSLGIGANTAIFSLVNGILLRPLPFKDPERLVFLSESSQQVPMMAVSIPNFIDWRDQNQVFDRMAAFVDQTYNLTGFDESERLLGRMVTADYFSVLGVQPSLGRTFTHEEDKPGGARGVVLSDGFWWRRFGGDPNVLGRTLTLNNNLYTVIGVMPKEFSIPSQPGELWTSLGLVSDRLMFRGFHFGTFVYARRKPGVTLEQARAEMGAIAKRLQEQYPQNKIHDIAVEDLTAWFVRGTRSTLWLLLGAVGFVLLIACANVASLLLGRAVDRQREIAIRAALGAGRARIIRQLLTESVVLALCAGVAGLLFGFEGMRGLKALLPENTPRLNDVQMDGWVLSFSVGVALLTGLVFGLAPALHGACVELNKPLKEGARGTGGGGSRLHGALVVAEVALSLVLLIGAGLMMKSVWRVQQSDLGFDPAKLLSFQLSLPEPAYAEPQKRSAFLQQLTERLKPLPGVEVAAVTTLLPLGSGPSTTTFAVEDQPPAAPEQLPVTDLVFVSPDYFRALRMPLLRGRYLTEQDRADSPPVVVVDETVAKTYWPGQDPVGKQINLNWPNFREPRFTIVGVVQHVKNYGVDQPSRFETYVPYTQDPRSPVFTLVLRTSMDPASFAAAARASVRELDRNLPIHDLYTMDEYVARHLAERRLSMILLGLFAAVAVVLAAVGIYGVMSYSVTQRTHEIGLRLALGAKPADVLRLVVRHGLVLTLIGVGVGLVGAFALTRLITKLLFEVSATDPATFVGVASLLVMVALLACYLPARRATKVDPMVALRYE